MKRSNKEDELSNLLMAQHNHLTITKWIQNSFKKRNDRIKGNIDYLKKIILDKKKKRHYKSQYSKKRKAKESKKIMMIVSKVILMKLVTESWWVDFVAIRHIQESRTICQY